MRFTRHKTKPQPTITPAISPGEIHASADELVMLASKIRELAPRFAVEQPTAVRRLAVVQLAAICNDLAVDLARVGTRLREELR